MEDYENYKPEKLEQCTYRYLQQTAKGMGLPSNVKKIHLIRLICAKKFRTPQEVEAIVYQVRQERQRLAQVRKTRNKGKKKMRLQGTEISSTNNSCSPPITNTPKSHMSIRYSPQDREFIRYKPKTSLINHNKSLSHKNMPSPKKSNASDRVLRSFNMKTRNYGVLNMNKAVFSSIKPSGVVSEETTINIVGLDGRCQKFNVTAVVRKRQNNDIAERRLVHASTSMNLSMPTKRKRTLSGIYPLKDNAKPNQYVSSLVRKTDGRLGKINTYIQRPKVDLKRNDVTIQDIIDCNVTQSLTNAYVMENEQSAKSINKRYMTEKVAQCAETTLRRFVQENNAHCAKNSPQSLQKRYFIANNAQCTGPMGNRYIIENNIQPGEYFNANTHDCVRTEDNRFIANTQYSKPHTNYTIENMLCGKSSTYYNNDDVINITKDNHHGNYILDQEKSAQNSDCILPKINAVFSKFGDVHCTELTKPVYVQVCDESERFQNYPLYVAKSNQYNTTMLESLYNFKSQFVINQPLLKITTSAETKCVFSTPVLTTPKVQPSATVVSGGCNNLCERDNQQYGAELMEPTPRVYDYFRTFEPESPIRTEFHTDEVLSSSSSMGAGLDSTQELGANVTIPEMVEDALEIISQDGDYMERIGMDVRMQCILCSWAGPKIILEYHVRKEHSSQISFSLDGAWAARFSLGSLAGGAPRGDARLVDHGELLYCLSAHYRHPGRCRVALAMLSTDIDTPRRGKVTTYNKVTGEPYTWEGTIPPLPPTMSYEDDDCLNLEISRLNLLPTSVNLKLFNRELVMKSQNNVGHSELEDVHIVVHVKWFGF